MEQSDVKVRVCLQRLFNSKFPNLWLGAPRDVKEEHRDALPKRRIFAQDLNNRRKPKWQSFLDSPSTPLAKIVQQSSLSCLFAAFPFQILVHPSPSFLVVKQAKPRVDRE